MRKSELLEMIKEEVEVILTDDEAVEMFDLDLSALLENLAEDPSYKGQERKEIIAEVGTAADRVMGQDPNQLKKVRSPQTYGIGERNEIAALIKDLLDDGVYSPDERKRLLYTEHIETFVGEVLASLKSQEAISAFLRAAETFRRAIKQLSARETRGAAADAAAAAKGEAGARAPVGSPKLSDVITQPPKSAALARRRQRRPAIAGRERLKKSHTKKRLRQSAREYGDKLRKAGDIDEAQQEPGKRSPDEEATRTILKEIEAELRAAVEENSVLSEKKKEKWIQGAEADIKRRGTEGVCTGDKYGSKSCPKGSKRYNLAKTFRKMAKKRKKKSKKKE